MIVIITSCPFAITDAPLKVIPVTFVAVTPDDESYTVNGFPLNPDVPLDPDVPFVPLDPDVPFVPDVPDVPDEPELPLVPDVPCCKFNTCCAVAITLGIAGLVGDVPAASATNSRLVSELLHTNSI